MAYRALSRDEVCARIRDIARSQFLTQGIARTEMKDLAERADVSRSTLYRCYAHKHQLAFVVADDIMQALSYPTLMRGEFTAASGWEKLSEYVNRLISSLCERKDELLFLAEFDQTFAGEYPDFPEARAYANTNSACMRYVVEIAAQGMADGSIRANEDAATIAAIITNTAFALIQRILPRLSHINAEHGIDGIQIARKAISNLVNSIRNR